MSLEYFARTHLVGTEPALAMCGRAAAGLVLLLEPILRIEAVPTRLCRSCLRRWRARRERRPR